MWCTGITQAASRFWRRYVAAEDPDVRREGVRQQRIDDLTVCAGLLEAMRLWDEDRKSASGRWRALSGANWRPQLPVELPHAKDGPVDLVRWGREGLQVDAHDIVVAHRPRQAHQQPPDPEPAPVRQQRGLHGLLELDVKLLHFKRADGVGDKIDIGDGSPGDKPEAVDEKPVLVRANPHPALGERKKVVSGAARPEWPGSIAAGSPK